MVDILNIILGSDTTYLLEYYSYRGRTYDAIPAEICSGLDAGDAGVLEGVAGVRGTSCCLYCRGNEGQRSMRTDFVCDWSGLCLEVL